MDQLEAPIAVPVQIAQAPGFSPNGAPIPAPAPSLAELLAQQEERDHWTVEIDKALANQAAKDRLEAAGKAVARNHACDRLRERVQQRAIRSARAAIDGAGGRDNGGHGNGGE